MDLLQNIQTIWIENLDKRIVHFSLLASNYQVPLIILAYLYFVLVGGPNFMKNRPPYSLKTCIRIYNIVQIIVNMFLLYTFYTSGVNLRSLFMCPISDYSDNDVGRKLVLYGWYFTLSKILDYIDTIIFILRKKNNQVSILHLYHHISTLLISWIIMRYVCIIATMFLGSINVFIHVIMYTYYFLSAYGPKVRKTIAPFKQWLTIMQMVQFVIMMIYILQNVFPNCKSVPHIFLIMHGLNLIFNFSLFYNFYQKTYNKSKKLQ